jgi:hypothetical protein
MVFWLEIPIGSRFLRKVSIWPWYDPISYFLRLHIVHLPRCAFWAMKHYDMFLLCRDTPFKRLSRKSPLTSPNWGDFGENVPTVWDYKPIDEIPQRYILGRNRIDWCVICGIRALGVGCALDQHIARRRFLIFNGGPLLLVLTIWDHCLL